MKKLIMIVIVILGVIGCSMIVEASPKTIILTERCEGIDEAVLYRMGERTMIRFHHDGNCCDLKAGLYSYDYVMWIRGTFKFSFSISRKKHLL